MVEVFEDFDQEMVVIEIEDDAHGTIKGYTQVLRTKEITHGFVQVDEVTKYIEGLVVNLNDFGIIEDVKIDVNMVEISQIDEMEVDEEAKIQEWYN